MKNFRKNGTNSGFTLLEVIVVLAILAILSAAAVAYLKANERSSGFRVGMELRQIWQKQKERAIDSLANPATAGDPQDYTMPDLFPEKVSRNFLALKLGTVNLRTLPPTHSLDGTRGDSAKTTANSGDGLYDVGPEK